MKNTYESIGMGISLHKDIIDDIEKNFSDKVPHTADVTLRDIYLIQGQQAVIKYLKFLKTTLDERRFN